jgi:hypothetical protein
MRTIKAKFSGGGTLVTTFETDGGPRTWEAAGVPPEVVEPNWAGSPGSVRGVLEYAAKANGQTVEIEDDAGPVAHCYCTVTH